MYRTIPALVASLVVATLLASPAAHAAPNCTTGHCVYLSLIRADAPPAVALIGQSFTYTDTIDYLHIIGEVRNTTATPVWLIRIVANIFDSQQHLVATDSSYAFFDPLPTNASTCFDVALKAPADVGSIQFEKPTYSVSTDVIPQLSVINDSGTYNANLHSYGIIGQVRNDDTVQVKFVTVIATLYNASGQAISCDLTYINSTDLDPGQTSSFSLSTVGRDFSDVASYKLQAQGDRQ